MELSLTGRGADEIPIERAELVAEMVGLKHPFLRGIKARMGFDYPR